MDRFYKFSLFICSIPLKILLLQRFSSKGMKIFKANIAIFKKLM